MADLTVHAQIDLAQHDGRAWTTSIDVAQRFGKRHDNVMQAIRGLECSPEFTALNFQGSDYTDSTGRKLPAFHISRDGFVFLAMGFTGAEAARWKERYIAAFNAMELQLRTVSAQDERWHRDIIERQTRIQEVLTESLHTTRADVSVIKSDIADIKSDFGLMKADVYDLKARLRLRAYPQKKAKDALHFAMAARGWRCPCCETPAAASGFEIDHFFDVGRAGVNDLWMICKQCHADLSSGRLTRHEVRSTFDAFHEFLRRKSPQRALDFGTR